LNSLNNAVLIWDAWIIKYKILLGNVHKQGLVEFSVWGTFNYNWWLQYNNIDAHSTICI